MKNLLILLITIFGQIIISKLHAEEFKHREISLRSKGWNIIMTATGDLLIGSGADMFDRGHVYREIYSYKQFYKEVVDVMESGAGPNPEGRATVGISVRPMDPKVLYEPHMPADPNHAARTDPLRVAISHSYDATDLWNGLLKKLLPAMEALKPDQVSDLLVREPPFIKVEGGDDFELPRLRPRMVGTREEKVARVMASLTPEQRVALGHQAEYPPSKQSEGDNSVLEGKEQSRADPAAGESEQGESSDGKDPAGKIHQGSPISPWGILIISLTLVSLAWIVGKRRSRL
jgi:hypothetical protein